MKCLSHSIWQFWRMVKNQKYFFKLFVRIQIFFVLRILSTRSLRVTRRVPCWYIHSKLTEQVITCTNLNLFFSVAHSDWFVLACVCTARVFVDARWSIDSLNMYKMNVDVYEMIRRLLVPMLLIKRWLNVYLVQTQRLFGSLMNDKVK